jgi:hypothetical protein
MAGALSFLLVVSPVDTEATRFGVRLRDLLGQDRPSRDGPKGMGSVITACDERSQLGESDACTASG